MRSDWRFLGFINKILHFRRVSTAKNLLNFTSLVFIIIYRYVFSVGNFVQLLVFRVIVDPSVRRGSDGPREVKKLQKVHKTPTYRPMGLIR